MAAGVPVVGSDRGLEGLQVDAPTQRALRANRPQEYVSAIAQLFDSPQLRAQLSQNGRHYIANEYSWESAGQQYEAFLFGK
jgi:glycosyltransferase involved in cell wall biosynthesis